MRCKIYFSLIVIIMFELCYKTFAWSSILRYSTVEKLQPMLFVGSVASDLKLYTELSETQMLSMEFSLDDSQVAAHFKLHNVTGILKTSTSINRDLICPGERVCELCFYALIKDNSIVISKVKIVVAIEDVNDFVPIFALPVFSFSIPENAPLGSKYNIPTAKDDDSPVNGIKKFYIVDRPFYFDLEYACVNDLWNINLILINKFKGKILLTIAAEDTADPANVGYLNVTISTTPNNDPPQFYSREYHVFLVAPVYANSTIIQLQTKSSNNSVLFQFSTLTLHIANDLFDLDNQAGVIKLIRNIDSGKSYVYNLSILAFDSKNSALAGTTNVYIKIINNDELPKIIFERDSQKVDAVLLPFETVTNGTYVARVKVTDFKYATNECWCLLSNKYFSFLKISECKEYIIISKFDLATIFFKQIYLNVSCQLLNHQIYGNLLIENIMPLNKLFAFNVTLMHLNIDLKTEIEEIKLLSSNVPEIRFYLENYVEAFNLNTESGLLTVKKSYAFNQTNFVLRISVYGNDTNNLIDRLFISLEDVRESILKTKMYTYNLIESELHPNKTIGSLDANPTVKNMPIEYKFYFENGSIINRSSFDIDCSTMKIFNPSIDIFKKLKILKIFLNIKYKSTIETAVIYIKILPSFIIFIFPTSNNNSISLPGNSPVGSFITRVTVATQPENDTINFAIQGGSYNFEIDGKIGDITLKRPLETSIAQYKLNITVTSSENRTASEMIIINVIHLLPTSSTLIISLAVSICLVVFCVCLIASIRYCRYESSPLCGKAIRQPFVHFKHFKVAFSSNSADKNNTDSKEDITKSKDVPQKPTREFQDPAICQSDDSICSQQVPVWLQAKLQHNEQNFPKCTGDKGALSASFIKKVHFKDEMIVSDDARCSEEWTSQSSFVVS